MHHASIVSMFAGLTMLAACAPRSGTCGEERLPPTVICEEAAAPAVAGPAGLPHTLTVSGTGVASTAPDAVHIQFGIHARHAEAPAVLADSRARLDRIRGELALVGVADKDVQLTSYTLGGPSNIDPNTGTRHEGGEFTVDNAVSVMLRDPSRLQEVLARGIGSGAGSVMAVTFTLSDPKQLAQQARDLAMADAQARAEQLARAAGVTLGRPLSIQDNGSSTSPMDMYAYGSMAPAPGQMQHVQSLMISYRIP